MWSAGHNGARSAPPVLVLSGVCWKGKKTTQESEPSHSCRGRACAQRLPSPPDCPRAALRSTTLTVIGRLAGTGPKSPRLDAVMMPADVACLGSASHQCACCLHVRHRTTMSAKTDHALACTLDPVRLAIGSECGGDAMPTLDLRAATLDVGLSSVIHRPTARCVRCSLVGRPLTPPTLSLCRPLPARCSRHVNAEVS